MLENLFKPNINLLKLGKITLGCYTLQSAIAFGGSNPFTVRFSSCDSSTIDGLQYDIAIGKEELEWLLSSPSLSLYLPRHDGGGEGEGQSRLENGGEEGLRRRLE
jgi:hypothetical protein